MTEQARPSPLALFQDLTLEPFEPKCFYIAELDCFWYVARDCSYVATRTNDPHIEFLMCRGEKVGLKILNFFGLPRETRDACLAQTGIDLDSIRGIEAIWINNDRETTKETDVAQEEFFARLRRGNSRSY